MIYLLLCCRPREVKRRYYASVVNAALMAAYWREQGYAVTVLPRLKGDFT
jgi:hypothetical protein